MTQKIVVSKPGFDALDQSGNISQLLDSNIVNSIFGGTALSGEGGQAQAQSFISTTEKIKSVDLKLFAFGTPADNMQLDIVSSLGGASLGSVVLPSGSINSGAATNFAFSSDVGVTSEGTYYLQLTRSGIRDTSNYWAWYLQFNTNPYADGHIYNRDSGVWGDSGANLTSDYYFKIYVDSAANPENLNYSSDYNSLKYYTSGTVPLSIVGNGSTQTKEGTVTHNLGYVPFFIAYANDLDFPTRYNIVPYNNGAGTVIKNGNAYAGTSNIIFQFQSNPASGTKTLTFVYKIYRNNLGL